MAGQMGVNPSMSAAHRAATGTLRVDPSRMDSDSRKSVWFDYVSRIQSVGEVGAHTYKVSRSCICPEEYGARFQSCAEILK